MAEPLTMRSLRMGTLQPVGKAPIQAPLTMGQVRGRVPAVESIDTRLRPIITLRDIAALSQRRQSRGVQDSLCQPHMDLYAPTRIQNVIPWGTWKDRRCFIVGGGPSLRNFDWSLLKGELTIGINRAFEQFSPSVIFSIDMRFWGWIVRGDLGGDIKKKFEDYMGYKVWLNTSCIDVPDEDIYITDTPNGGNSGHAALNFAIKMGANPIYLLGFDLKGDGRGRAKWFHEGYPEFTPESIYKKYITRFELEAVPRVKDAGVQVVNLSKNSALNCFPKGDAKKVLGKKPIRPMVVSYYTKSTGYEDEAKRLIRTLHGFGYEYDVRAIPNLGSWQANTQFKAKFIRAMMDEYPYRDILWLDADSVLLQYPEEFDNAKFDLGVHTIDWKLYTNGRRKDKQLANAAIYAKNNNIVRKFMDAWIRANDKNPEKIEMQTMQAVLNRWKKKLNYYNIPATYCQIFDSMAAAGEPVIEQTQASRRLRHEVEAKSEIEKTEKKKYDHCWDTFYHRSGCAIPTAHYISETTKKGYKLLDMGCGDGTTAMFLRDMGYNCSGVDITLNGLNNDEDGFYEAPLWNLPFEDNEFDYTFSTDVLEHIPREMLSSAIREIYRVTKYKTFHCIALFKGIKDGVTLHMTVEPIDWWEKQMNMLNTKTLDLTVIARKDFMAGREKPRPEGV